MIKEMYIRPESDPNYAGTLIEFTDDVERILTEIRVLLGTKEGEVLCNWNFGTRIEDLVFKTRNDSASIVKEISEKIADYVWADPNYYNIGVGIEFGDSGEGYDYAVLDVTINGEKMAGFLIDKS